VGAFNRRHARSGTLWDGRFRAGVIEPGAHTLSALLHIDLLPASDAWRSAAHRLGQRTDRLVSDPPEFWALGNTPFEREAAYAARLERGLDAATQQQLDHTARQGWALGSPAFLAEVADASQRPVRPRPRGRPLASG
jgi:putative transposase